MSFARLIALAIRNPIVTAASFVAVVMLFTTLLVVSYPSGDEQALPVVEAKNEIYKSSPDFESGMEIAHEDSTVFGAVRGIEAQGGIENLLASADSEDSMSVSKEELLAAQDANPDMNEKDLELLALLSEELKAPATPSDVAAVEEPEAEPIVQQLAALAPKKTETKTQSLKVAAKEPVKTVQKTLEKTAQKVAVVSAPKTKPSAPKAEVGQLASLQSAISEDAAPAPVKTAPTSAIKQAPQGIQISRIDPALTRNTQIEVTNAPRDSNDAPNSATSAKPQFKAGSSPDTLEFVRSVLDQKDSKAAGATAGTLNNIATAAGTAGGTAAADLSRNAYVQLGSVRSADGGEAEWAKLQAQFSSELKTAPHRVSRVDLGEKGTFYRIQAGPFTAAQASAICDSIKAQKPGGCLIVR